MSWKKGKIWGNKWFVPNLLKNVHVHAHCTHILEVFWGAPSQLTLSYTFHHRRRKCERCSPNSLRPISYFGSIWELYVLDLKTKVFCRKEKGPATFSHGQGTHSAKIVLIIWPEIPQMHCKCFAYNFYRFCLWSTFPL